VTLDPWEGPWVRIWKSGCPAIWWQSDLDARPHDPISWCRATERIYAESKDGSKVPFVLIKPTSGTPKGLLVVGYGAYGISTPLQTAHWEPLLNSGWALAIGLWRGGGDDTPEWEDAGRLTGRIRVLEDAEAVVRKAQQISNVSARRTVLYGRSAGGLWVGGLSAKFPDGSLAGGAYIEVGYLDAFRTMRNPHLPLTQLETDEFGLPAQRLSDSIGALRWSPMDLLRPKGTPGMWQIVRTAVNDKEVFAYESVKWVMKSRAGRTARASRVYLAIESDQGHFVSDGGVQAALDQAAILHLVE
jgi:oligopeptidase B